MQRDQPLTGTRLHCQAGKMPWKKPGLHPRCQKYLSVPRREFGVAYIYVQCRDFNSQNSNGRAFMWERSRTVEGFWNLDTL